METSWSLALWLDLLSSCLVARRLERELNFAEVVRAMRLREPSIRPKSIKVVRAAESSAGIELARFLISKTNELTMAKGISNSHPRTKPIKLV